MQLLIILFIDQTTSELRSQVWDQHVRCFMPYSKKFSNAPRPNVILDQSHQSFPTPNSGKSDYEHSYSRWQNDCPSSVEGSSTTIYGCQLRFQLEIHTSKATKVQEINLLCVTEVMPFGKCYFKSDFEGAVICSLLDDKQIQSKGNSIILS